jgi:hypothetical protein
VQLCLALVHTPPEQRQQCDHRRHNAHDPAGPNLAWRIADQLGWTDTFTAEYIALTQLQADAFGTLDAQLAWRAMATRTGWTRSARVTLGGVDSLDGRDGRRAAAGKQLLGIEQASSSRCRSRGKGGCGGRGQAVAAGGRQRQFSAFRRSPEGPFRHRPSAGSGHGHNGRSEHGERAEAGEDRERCPTRPRRRVLTGRRSDGLDAWMFGLCLVSRRQRLI